MGGEGKKNIFEATEKKGYRIHSNDRKSQLSFSRMKLKGVANSCNILMLFLPCHENDILIYTQAEWFIWSWTVEMFSWKRVGRNQIRISRFTSFPARFSPQRSQKGFVCRHCCSLLCLSWLVTTLHGDGWWKFVRRRCAQHMDIVLGIKCIQVN